MKRKTAPDLGAVFFFGVFGTSSVLGVSRLRVPDHAFSEVEGLPRAWTSASADMGSDPYSSPIPVNERLPDHATVGKRVFADEANAREYCALFSFHPRGKFALIRALQELRAFQRGSVAWQLAVSTALSSLAHPSSQPAEEPRDDGHRRSRDTGWPADKLRRPDAAVGARVEQSTARQGSASPRLRANPGAPR